MQNLVGTFEKRSPELLWNQNGSCKTLQGCCNKREHTAMKQSQQCKITDFRTFKTAREQRKDQSNVKVVDSLITSPFLLMGSFLPVKSGGLKKKQPLLTLKARESPSFVHLLASLTSFLCYMYCSLEKNLLPVAYVAISFSLPMSLLKQHATYSNYPSKAFRKVFFHFCFCIYTSQICEWEDTTHVWKQMQIRENLGRSLSAI